MESSMAMEVKPVQISAAKIYISNSGINLKMFSQVLKTAMT